MASLHKYCSPEQTSEKMTALVIMLINKNDDSLKKILKNIKAQQDRDPCLREVIKAVKDNGNGEDYVVFEDVLFHRERENANWRLVIPKALSLELIKITHIKLGHPGVYKTLEYLKRFYYWNI